MNRSLLYACDAAVDQAYRGSGAAVVVRTTDGQIVATSVCFLAGMTNNEAEYAAFILGLQLALARAERWPIFLSDSQIMVGQIAGRFAVRDAKLQPYHICARRLLAHLPEAILVFTPRQYNQMADALAKETLRAGLAKRAREKQ
ncbi:MAG: ribonuclease HI family protein [Anaerolineae bacterium]|nr:ribonuclease HI family protein [Anaerolineae bacterium]